MHRFRFRFRWAKDGFISNAYEIQVKDIDAATPISAINQFHAFCQLSREVDGDRKTTKRPFLKPWEYSVVSVHQIYHDAALHKNPSAQPIIESEIDYPKSANPDLVLEREVGANPFRQETPEFKFS